MNNEILNWLLCGESYIQYAVKLQLIEKQPDLNSVLNDKQILNIITRLKGTEKGLPALMSGKIYYTQTGNVYWDLFFLADIGLKISDIKIEQKVNDFLNSQMSDGAFVTQNNTRPGYFCIPTILVASLVKMGLKNDKRIDKYIDLIVSTQRLDGGWHCAKRRAIGQPLESSVSCPMDNLNILMLLGQYEEFKTSERLNSAIDLLLSHWDKRNESWRPYGFGIGSQFKKLKYPAVKYGILRVLDVLSLYPYAVNTKSFQNMLSFVNDKAVNGRYYAESVVKSFSAFDFGQKKEPSRFITFIVKRIEKRVAAINS